MEQLEDIMIEMLFCHKYVIERKFHELSDTLYINSMDNRELFS
jgi:hypothetical protein